MSQKKYKLSYRYTGESWTWQHYSDEIPALDLMMWVWRLPIDEEGKVFIEQFEFELVS